MAYVRGPDTTDLDRTLVWVDRKGVAVPLSDVHRPYASPRISPDGRQIAVSILESGNYQIWVCEPASGGTAFKFTVSYKCSGKLVKPIVVFSLSKSMELLGTTSRNP
jgi:Tol biopolymer transport system component